MKAIILHSYGGPDELKLEDDDMPEPGVGEVRVRLRATSVKPVDWKIRSGSAKARFPLELPEILGVDVAGEVDEEGMGVEGFPKGMRVMAKANGTYAQYTVAKADTLSPIPDALDFEHAAALPLVLITGAQLIERAAKVKPGQRVLVTGALGSVGRVAVHVALHHGAKVVAGVKGAQLDAARELGAAEVVALDAPDAIATLKDLDVVADTVGGTVGEQVIRALKDGGTYASVVGEPKTKPERGIQVHPLMAQPDASRLYQLADDVARGALVIPIAKVMPLEQVAEAHRLGEAGGVGGKIVLRIA